MDKIIDQLENTNAEIETTIDNLNKLYYQDDTIEANIESEQKFNDEDEKQDKIPNRKCRIWIRTNAPKFFGKRI